MARRRTRRRQRGGRDEKDITEDIQKKIKDLEQLRKELEEEKARKAAASDKAKSRWGKIGTRGLAQIGVEKAKKTLAEIEQKKQMESTADDILSETDLSPPSKPSVKRSHGQCKKLGCTNPKGKPCNKDSMKPCDDVEGCVLSKPGEHGNNKKFDVCRSKTVVGGRKTRRRRKRTKKRRKRKRKKTKKR
jgi:hypothetical protein